MNLELIERLPKKARFRPAELVRIYDDTPGFSRPRVYQKLAEGKIQFERTSEHGILIRREWIVAYFLRLEEI